MSTRIRVVLAIETDLPANVRAELDDSLVAAGWFAASDDYTCWVCRARSHEMEELERQVRGALQFAAFNAGVHGRLPYALKVGDEAPKVTAIRMGSAERRTKSHGRARGLDFATERISNGGASSLPNPSQLPGVTQLKTAF
jgi:hypothetical protein